MTRDEAKQLLPIIQAYAEGKTIQISTSSGWEDLGDPSFNWKPASDYRIKPEPVECWAVVTDYDKRVLRTYRYRDEATNDCDDCIDCRVIRMREVL